MSIESALFTALSGLRATQAQIQVVSGNVANVQTQGYSREILPQETVVNAASTSVSTGAVQRVVDQVLNSNLTNQTTTASAAATLDTYYQQIDALMGQTGSGATLNNALSGFSSAMQAVATTPQDPVAQGAAVSAAQTLAQTLNQMSAGIQQIREGTDSAISTDVTTLNTALQSIANTNQQISQLKAEGQSTAVLEDQRDQALNQVAQLIGVTSFTTGDGAMIVMTTTGQTLVDGVGAGSFSYTPSGNVSAATTLSGVKLNGIDITGDLTNGSIGALVQLRDVDLPGLTAQLNQFTNNLFNATAVTQSGVTFTNSGGVLAAGDSFTATVDGTTYTTAGLPANPAMTDLASALNTQFKAQAAIGVSGGAPQAGDIFTATIDGNVVATAALSGAGPFGSSDIVNALNATLTAINVPVTVNTPAAGDQFDVTINGTTYTTAALSGGGPFAATDIAAAIQAAIPSNYTATVNGGNIQIVDTTGALTSASIALNTGTGTETFGAGVQASTYSTSLDSGGNIAFKDSSGNPITVSLVKSTGTGTETFTSPGTIVVSGGAPQSGDVFQVTIDGTMVSTAALSGSGTLSTSDIVNALNNTLTAINVPVTVNTPVNGDRFDVMVNGTTYTTAPLSGSGPFTSTDIANAIQAALPSNFTATVNGGSIEIADTAGALTSASIALHSGSSGTESFSTGVQATKFSASVNTAGNIAFTDSSGKPVTVSLVKTSGTGTETFAATTLSASVVGGNLALTDSSGQPMTATLATNPIFTAGTPNNLTTPTTIDFAQTSGSFNVGQTFDVTVDGTDFGSTGALSTGTTSLAGLANVIQALFTAKGVGYTASVVGGQLEIADPAGNPITASVTLNAGAGTSDFTAGLPTTPLNTTNSGLGATNDANHFFAGVDLAAGIDNAATIQVNPALIADNGLLLNGVSGADPSISQNLVANLGQNYTFQAAGSFTNATTTTLGSYSSQIVGQVASAAASAKSNSTFQSSLQSQLASQAGSVSGVNIDEELSNLIQYQNAYGANARVITVIQTLYDTLMRM
jgi:flagellar hook-associated protein 1